MDITKLSRSDWFAALGGIVLALSVFIRKTYEARPESPTANINGLKGTVSIWQVHDLMRWLLLLAAIAPIVLLYILARDIKLSWPRGEMTAVVGLAAITLILYTGVIDRPGDPSGEIELDWSWYTAAGGALAIAFGGALRASSTERKRKPPGVL
jgi:hypothetical protein